jgi:hypothetical protein
MDEWDPAPERDIRLFPQFGNSKMERFRRLFQVWKDWRVGIRITIFEEVLVKCVCDLGTIAIIHSPEINVRLHQKMPENSVYSPHCCHYSTETRKK